MSKTPKDLEPDLRVLYTYVEESGEDGIGLGKLLDTLKKDRSDIKAVTSVLDNLGTLMDLGYVHRKIIETKTEMGYEGKILWFAVGKGESLQELQYGGISLRP